MPSKDDYVEEPEAMEAQQVARPRVEELDEILGVPLKVLDDGFVRVVDYMGSDESIVQVQLDRSGASYKARSRVFLEGSPLNVTDLAVGTDGALYVGGVGVGEEGGLVVPHGARRIALAGQEPGQVKVGHVVARVQGDGLPVGCRRLGRPGGTGSLLLRS